MPDRARVTHPDARVMLTTGNIRIPHLPDDTDPSRGWTEFNPDGWEIEIIPDPDPDWAPEDVVVDSAGEKFVRTPAGRWRHILGEDTEPVRPLTLLVPQT